MSESDPAEILHEGRFIRMVRRDGWEYVEHPHIRGIVVLIAVTPDDRLLLVEQYRTPVGRRVIELPAGMVGDRPGESSEDFADAARRELVEETGFSAQRLTRVMAGPYSPGRSSDLYTFFLASGLQRVGDGGGDGEEDIVSHAVPLREIDAWLDARVADGLLVDPKIFAGLYILSRASRRGP